MRVGEAGKRPWTRRSQPNTKDGRKRSDACCSLAAPKPPAQHSTAPCESTSRTQDMSKKGNATGTQSGSWLSGAGEGRGRGD